MKNFYINRFADLTKYSVCEISDSNEWDNFIENNSNGNIYFLSNYDEVNNPNRKFFILKGNQIVGGFTHKIINNEYLNANHQINSGIVYGHAREKQIHSQITSEQFRINSYYSQFITENCVNLNSTFSPEFKDLRPFSWTEFYGLPKASFEPKFSCKISLDNSILNCIKDDVNITYLSFNKSRRQEIRYGLKNKAQVTIHTDITKLEKTIMDDHSDNKSFRYEFDSIKPIIKNLIKHKRCFISSIENDNGVNASTCVIGVFKNIGYYLFGMNNKLNQNSYNNSITLFESMKHCKRLGCETFDFEGINSPERGYFKLSFGGHIYQYMNIKLSSNQ